MLTSAPDPLLNIAGLSTGYGKIGVLRGIDMTVGAGEVVALLGPNGAGKTTLVACGVGIAALVGTHAFRRSRSRRRQPARYRQGGHFACHRGTSGVHAA